MEALKWSTQAKISVGENSDINKTLSPPHDLKNKIVFTKVRIYLYIVF